MSPLDAYALTVVALFVKLFCVVVVQGRYRLAHGIFTKPEDAACWGDGTVSDAEHSVVDRAQRTLRNDLENVPIFLFLGWTYVALEAWPTGAAAYFAIFVASRIVHTIAYLRPMQPLRNRAYLVGLIVCLALCGHIVAEVVARQTLL